MKIHLKKYVRKNYMDMQEPAIELGITRQYLSMICGGKEQPSPKLAMKIELWSKGEITKEYLRPDIWK